MELVHIYNTSTIIQELFVVFNIFATLCIIALSVWSIMCSVDGVDFSRYKTQMITIIVLVLLMVVNIALVDWTPEQVEVYVVEDMDVLEDKLNEYRIIDNAGKIYRLRKISLDN